MPQVLEKWKFFDWPPKIKKNKKGNILVEIIAKFMIKKLFIGEKIEIRRKSRFFFNYTLD